MLRWMQTKRIIFCALAVLMATASSIVLSAETASTAGAATVSTLQVGAIVDEQTPCQEAGQLQTTTNTIKAWASYVNAHGGISGHKVNMTVLNSQCSPSVAEADANQLISKHVIAIIDATAVDSAFAKVVDAAKIPVLCGPSSANLLYCSTDANYYPSGMTEIPGAYGTTYAIKKAGKTHMGFMYCTDVSTCAQAVPFFAALTKEVGLQYSSVGASETAPNYTAPCLAMKAAGVDALFVGGPPAATVAASCSQQGYHPIYPQNVGTWSSKYLPNAAFNGAVGATGDIPWNIVSPATKEFRAAESKVLAESEFPYEVSSMFAAGLLLQTALANAPANPGPSAVYSGLYALKGSTLGGFSPPLTYTQGKPTTVSCFFIMGIKNHKWNAPYGAKYFCQPAASS